MDALSDITKDGLTEIINIGTGMAASALFQLLHHEVLLNVPDVQIISSVEAAQLIVERSSARDVSAVSMLFSGPLKGKAYLLFADTDMAKLTRIYIGEELSERALKELESEVVLEMGNILLNSCLAGFSQILGGEYVTDLPYYYRGPVLNAFKDNQQDSNVLFIKVRFDVRGLEVTGYVALVMGIKAMEMLVKRVDDYINGLSH